MDLENGGSIYVSPDLNRTVEIRIENAYSVVVVGRLTTEEARVLANTLLGAVADAESPSRAALPAQA